MSTTWQSSVLASENINSRPLIMYRNTFTAVALLAQHVSAQNMLRFGCSQLTVERADPLVNPGMMGSPHTHQIIGGNSFNLTVQLLDTTQTASA
jgi:hypothetical protein